MKYIFIYEVYIFIYDIHMNWHNYHWILVFKFLSFWGGVFKFLTEEGENCISFCSRKISVS